MPTKVNERAGNAPTREIAPHVLYRGPQVADFAAMSYALFLRLVSEQKAPAPVVQAGRFTRWRASDVRDWLIALADGKATIGNAGSEDEK